MVIEDRRRVAANTERRYMVPEEELPVSCPLPQAAHWNSHPRVYLPLKPGADATCPYCGAVFSLVTGNPRR